MIEAGLLVHDYIDSYYMCDQEELDKSKRMKISETCKCLGITRYTLYKMIEAGLLVHDYIDSYYMCDQEELDKSLDKHVRAI